MLSTLAPFGLSACAMPNLDALTRSKNPATMASATGSGVKGDPMRIDTIAFADAYCRKDGMAEVAQRRLFDIKSSLTALGMTMPLPSPAETKAGSNKIYQLAALALYKDEMNSKKEKLAMKLAKHVPLKPKMAHTSGKSGHMSHFVHLGSYKSTRNWTAAG